MKKIIAKVSQFFKDVKERNKKKILLRRTKQLHDAFTIDERNDRIYIICEGTPVYEATLQESTESVLDRIQQMRQAAYQYYKVLSIRTKQLNN